MANEDRESLLKRALLGIFSGRTEEKRAADKLALEEARKAATPIGTRAQLGLIPEGEEVSSQEVQKTLESIFPRVETKQPAIGESEPLDQIRTKRAFQQTPITTEQFKSEAIAQKSLREPTIQDFLPIVASTEDEMATGGAIKEGQKTTLGAVRRASSLYKARESAEAAGGRTQAQIDAADRRAELGRLNTRLNSIATSLRSKTVDVTERARLDAERKEIEGKLGTIIEKEPGLIEKLSAPVREFLSGKFSVTVKPQSVKRIRVREKKTNQTGTIPENEYNEELYDRLP